jgi:hypothetical protein
MHYLVYNRYLWTEWVKVNTIAINRINLFDNIAPQINVP